MSENPTKKQQAPAMPLSDTPQIPDENDAANAKRENFLEVLRRNKKKDEAGISEADKKILKDLTCTVGKDGVLTVYRPDSNSPVMSYDAQKNSMVTYYDPNQSDDAMEHIDSLLTAAAAMRAENKGEAASVHIHMHDELTDLMAAKANELAGLKVANHFEKTLDQVNPELAKKMEQEWVKLGGQLPKMEETSVSRKSNASTVTGLVNPSESGIDWLPGLKDTFSLNVNKPAETQVPYAPTAPAPVVPAPRQLNR
jgi:hypothetical protein